MIFETFLGVDHGTATIHVSGELDSATAPRFLGVVERAVESNPRRYVIEMSGLTRMSPSGIRCLAFLEQMMEPGAQVIIVGAAPAIVETIQQAAFQSSVTIAESV